MNSYAAAVHLNNTAEAYAQLKAAFNYSGSEVIQHMWLEHIRTLPEDSKSEVMIDLPTILANQN